MSKTKIRLARKKWIKKFKNVDIQKSKNWGASVDKAFSDLFDVMSDCINETDVCCFSDCLPYDIYFGGDANVDVTEDAFGIVGGESDDEVTEMIADAIGNTATWRDIAIMLDTADWDRKVFILSEDGRLYAVTDHDFYETKDAVIDYIKNYD